MDWEAFSSNQRACLMAARALCSTLMSTEKSSRNAWVFTQKVSRCGEAAGSPSVLVKVHMQGRAELLRCSSGSSLRRLGGTVVIRIFTVASAELISKPVSLVSMVRTGQKEQEFLMEGPDDFKQHPRISAVAHQPGHHPHQTNPSSRGNCLASAHVLLNPVRASHLRWGPALSGFPRLCFPRLPQLPLGRSRRGGQSRAQHRASVGSHAAGYSRVGKIFRITTRSATLCPVVMVPFL